jgi:cobalt/nickel transport system permease protein
MIYIDKYAYLSRLKQTNPLQKLVLAVLVLGVCLWADSVAVSVLTLLIMGWYTVCKGGTPVGIFIRLMLVPLSFLVIGVLTIAVNVSGDKDVFVFSIYVFGMHIGVSQSGILSAANLFLKALGAVSCLYYLALSTPMVDLLAVLRKLKIPRLMVELMGLIYRFIFVFLEMADTMFTAQNSRLGYAGVSSGYRSLAALASSLFIRSYQRADELYIALEARGYDGELSVIHEQPETHWTEYIPIVLINLFLIAVALFSKQWTGGLL